MDSKPPRHVILFLFALAMAAIQAQQLCAQLFDYPTSKLPTSWINGPNIPHTITYPDGTTIKALLLRRDPSAPLGPSFAAGFYCRSSKPTRSPCRSNFVFGVFTVSTNSAGGIVINQGIPQLVWTANRGHPFGENATLVLTGLGSMSIDEADGSFVWRTATKSLTKELTIFADGSLRMLDPSGISVWSSEGRTGSVILPGQRLGSGKWLPSEHSRTNYWEDGRYAFRTTGTGFKVEFATNPGEWTTYKSYDFISSYQGYDTYAVLTNGNFSFFVNNTLAGFITQPRAPSLQFLRLDFNGQLKLYQWLDSNGWEPVAEMLPLESAI